MADPHPSDESLLKLASILVAEQSLEKTLRQILDLACAALPCGDDGGITLLEREGPRTAVATSETALEVDNAQYETEQGGPCLEAYRQQQIFRIESTADEARWPKFSRSAAAAGIKSTLSLPLVVGGDGIGALNIYCRQTGGFSEADEALGASFASYASVALANARVYWRTQRLAAQLEEALSTRGVIEQAKGILIARQGCSADQAFQLLVQLSQRTHVKLHDVARDLVDRARGQATAAGQDPAQPGPGQ
jgi:GAF domain-containing protein